MMGWNTLSKFMAATTKLEETADPLAGKAARGILKDGEWGWFAA